MTRFDPAAVEDFALAVSLVVRRMRAGAAEELAELSWTQKNVLTQLEREGPVAIADLARAASIKPQSMGTAVAGLEALGLVGRKPHPTDGRQVLIQLTAKGTAFRKSVRAMKHAWLGRAVGALDKHEQAALVGATAILKRLAEIP